MTPKHPLVSVLFAAALVAACSKDVNHVDEDHLGPVEVTTYDTIGEVRDANHGKQVFFAYGAVAAATKLPANGVASLMVFEDGSSMVGVQLNIDMAKEGSFYEVWLYPEGAPKTQWKSLGHARSVVGDVRHALKTEDPQDLRESLQIGVTLESDNGNPAPSETLVARSTLKPVKR